MRKENFITLLGMLCYKILLSMKIVVYERENKIELED